MKRLLLSLSLAAALFGFSGAVRADNGHPHGHDGHSGSYYGGYHGGHYGYPGGYRGYYPGYYGRPYYPYASSYGYYAPYRYAYPYPYQPGISFGIYQPGVAIQFGVYP